MRKKLCAMIAALTAVALGLCACGKYPAAKITGVPDAAYAVVGNGGMSVQQDRYIYFVNGYSAASDTATNGWNDTVRGGIYRLEIADTEAAPSVTETRDKAENDPYRGYFGAYTTKLPADVTPYIDEDDASNNTTPFVMHKVKDYDGKDVAQVQATCVVPKKVVDGNGAAVGGGISIFDGWIYYCSPVTLENSSGTILNERVEFFRTRLNGKNTESIYSSTSDTVKPEYGYYWYNGKTYLLVLDDGKLFSFVCTDKKVESVLKNKRNPAPIATGVTDIVFSQKPVWYKGMPSGGADDFVYYTRAVEETDNEPSGNVLERIRPDGKLKTVLLNDSTTVTLLSLQNGWLYYTAQNLNSVTTLYASDFAGAPLEDPDAEHAETRIDDLGTTTNLSSIFVGNDVVAYDEDSGTFGVAHYVLAVQNGNLVRITGTKGSNTVRLVEGASAVTVQFVEDGYAYYFAQAAATDTAYAALMRVALGGGPAEQITSGTALFAQTGFFAPEITAGYLFYVSDNIPTVGVENKTDGGYKTTSAGYVKIRRPVANDNEPEFFAGVLQQSDIPEPDPDPEDED